MGGRLEVRGLSKSFFGVRALRDVFFEVGAGELVGLIGPNGSGKTTAIDCISGFTKPDGGRITIDGTDVTGWAPHRITKRGVGRTFQLVRVFSTLTVRENLVIGGLGRSFAENTASLSRVDRLLEKLRLGHVAGALASEMSYGQKKLTELASGLMSRPRVLLLDEPIAAINPTLALSIIDEIRELHAEGLSILLVEHNIEAVMRLCERLVVLDQGEKIGDGPPSEVIASDRVQEAYFGR